MMSKASSREESAPLICIKYLKRAANPCPEIQLRSNAWKADHSSIGQADDTALISNDIQKLFYLLELTKIFCSKYQVELGEEKTKLQVFFTRKMAHSVAISKATSAIEIGGERIPFSTSAEHVGMLRSISGNEPAILERFKAHGKALSGVLHTGIAKGHRGNPASSLHIDKLYAIPVLMSGLARSTCSQ